ncbi:hypothetical protein [Clostridium sp. CTA-7]
MNEYIKLIQYGVKVRYSYQLDVTDNDMIYAIKCAKKSLSH